MSTASELFTPAQLAIVRQRSDWRGAFQVGHAWAVIFGAMAVFVAWPGRLTDIARGRQLIGARQLGLAMT